MRVDRIGDRVRHAVEAFATWPNDEERESALDLLRALSGPAYQGQAELFLAKSDVKPMGSIEALIIELLAEPLRG